MSIRHKHSLPFTVSSTIGSEYLWIPAAYSWHPYCIWYSPPCPAGQDCPTLCVVAGVFWGWYGKAHAGPGPRGEGLQFFAGQSFDQWPNWPQMKQQSSLLYLAFRCILTLWLNFDNLPWAGGFGCCWKFSTWFTVNPAVPGVTRIVCAPAWGRTTDWDICTVVLSLFYFVWSTLSIRSFSLAFANGASCDLMSCRSACLLLST